MERQKRYVLLHGFCFDIERHSETLRFITRILILCLYIQRVYIYMIPNHHQRPRKVNLIMCCMRFLFILFVYFGVCAFVSFVSRSCLEILISSFKRYNWFIIIIKNNFSIFTCKKGWRYEMGNQKRKSKKDTQYNGQQKKDKKTNNDLQSTTQKTKLIFIYIKRLFVC
jgi:hypothetical protein